MVRRGYWFGLWAVVALLIPSSTLAQELHKAAAEGNEKLIKTRLKDGDDIDGQDKKGNTPLLVALNHNQSGAANLLIQNDADVNIKNDDGDTALLIVLRKKMNNMAVDLIADYDADVDARNKAGETPLYIALFQNNDSQVLDELINAKPGIVAGTAPNGESLLIFALKNNRPDIASQLIDEGANVKVTTKDRNQDTPLSLAVKDHPKNKRAYQTVIETLIKVKKVDPNAPNGSGQTPLALAQNDDKLSKYLKDNGAKEPDTEDEQEN